MTVKARKIAQSVLVVAGILLSAYAYYVETSKEKDSSFTALCDINPQVSCSKVFTSRWGRGMGLLPKDSILNQPNSVFGILFYITLIILDPMQALWSAKAQVILCGISNLSSVWLAYILFYVLEDVCVVCISMYIINFSLLVSSVIRYRRLSQSLPKKRV